MTAKARPVVYLGSDDEVDLVLDLARFKRQGGFGSKAPATMPAGSGDNLSGTLETRPRHAAPETRPRNAAQHTQTVRPLRVVY